MSPKSPHDIIAGVLCEHGSDDAQCVGPECYEAVCDCGWESGYFYEASGKPGGRPVSGMFAPTGATCPLTVREGHWLLTCCLPAGHDGDCWCNNIRDTQETK